MRRFLVLLLLLAGFIGAGGPAFACATAAAAGECCPVNAPSGCTRGYEQVGSEASICCVTPTAPAQVVAAESGRELHVVQDDRGSPDPVALTVASGSSLYRQRAGRLAVPLLSAECADASLTYLHTARLRL
jgi:hypothetical protein